MTQEELNSMLSGDVDFDAVEVSDSEDDSTSKKIEDESSHWPPPAPTEDNKMVSQLDDVTRESELKASEIFDIIEGIGDDLMNAESRMNEALEIATKNVDMLTKLHANFPAIKTFEESLRETTTLKQSLEAEVTMLQDNGDQVMNIMDIMQYQDIHRQKIERVINVMRALSKYMNTLFSSDKDDSTRVSSANHIPGDTSTEDVMDNDEIEALLASFGG